MTPRKTAVVTPATDGVPRPVLSFARFARDQLGEEPQIEHPSLLLWRVVIEGEHVRASADFRRGQSKTKYVGGALTVNGKSRPALDWPELRTLWRKYERLAPKGNGALDPIPVYSGGAVLPAEVRQMYDQFVSIVGEGEVLAGRAGGRWLIGLDGSGGDGVRVIFTRTRHGRWTLGGRTPIKVIVGGEDKSALVGNDISKAIAALTRAHPRQDAACSAPNGKPARGARDNGVETRKMVVIRELGCSRASAHIGILPSQLAEGRHFNPPIFSAPGHPGPASW